MSSSFASGSGSGGLSAGIGSCPISSSSNNFGSQLPGLECNFCGSGTRWVVAKVEYARFILAGDAAALSNLGNAFTHHAVVILFICKHGVCGEESVWVTYEYGNSGVRVTKGYPTREQASECEIYNIQPLLYSQVDAIKNGMNWSGRQYILLIRNCQSWARTFLVRLKSATAEKLPESPFNFLLANIIKQETGEVLRSSVPMMFEKKMCIFFLPVFDNNVTVSEMAGKALEQTGLENEGYEWCQIAQRKKLPDGRIEWVEHAFRQDFNPPIENGAFYRVVVRKQKKMVVKVAIVEQGTGNVLRQDVEIELCALIKKNEWMVALKALEQTGLNADGYKWRHFMQRKRMANGSIEWMKPKRGDPIEDGALYTVFVSKWPWES